MNKKGFSLTELLATIAIMAVISLIGTISVLSIKAKIDERMFASKLELAIGAAQNWGQDNKNEVFPTDKTLSELIDAKYLEADEGNTFKDNHGKDIKNATIRIEFKNGRAYACIKSYPTGEDSSIAQKYFCTE